MHLQIFSASRSAEESPNLAAGVTLVFLDEDCRYTLVVLWHFVASMMLESISSSPRLSSPRLVID